VIPLLLADAPTGEAAKSGPWGLAIILLLVVACFFLFRSMSRHLRKVRQGFPVDGEQKPPASKPPSARPAVDLHKQDDGGAAQR
jgi:hypothetical protein